MLKKYVFLILDTFFLSVCLRFRNYENAIDFEFILSGLLFFCYLTFFFILCITSLWVWDNCPYLVIFENPLYKDRKGCGALRMLYIPGFSIG